MESFTWYVVRAMGLTAYLLLFLTVATGLLLSGPGGAWWLGVPVNALHRFLTWLVAGFLALHVVVLLFNHYLSFNLLQLLVPFTAAYEPFWTGVGVLALYLLVVVVYTSTAIRRELHNLVWYGLHLLSYPAFVLATAHGIAAGHDTRQAWALALYGACTVATAVLLAVRFTRLSTASANDLLRWGPGVLAGAALCAMVLALIGSRLA